MLKKVCFVLAVCFACVQLAQAASSLGFEVARTPEEIQQLAALSNDELAEHLQGLSNEAIAEQINVLNDGRHTTLLARILGSIVKNMNNFMDEGQRNSLMEVLNGLGLPFAINDEDGKVDLTQTGSGDPTPRNPFVTGDGFVKPSALSGRAVR
jgi:hypothetical protein